ncbi:MAG TPA: tRNA epoxyqueuosine(34) reductase QueG [Nitrospirales bacterium]|nr:tRNA epoxyqueuosine(34) reductase QueG [Nitrospirales bacterium]
MSPRPTLAHQIKEEARRLGFDAVGIARLPTHFQPPPCPPAPCTIPTEDQPITWRLWERLKKWLDMRFHGTMEWMAKDPKRRSDPAEVLPGCQSLVIVGMNYYTDQTSDESNAAGRIARYAWGKDYHTFMKDRLIQLENFLRCRVPDAQTKSYVDTGPIMEKPWAQEAGIGWIGKHTNIVSTDFGSWLLLGEILTTVPLDCDEPALDLCGTCSLCIQACPTGAIVEPYLLDAERCISYLTIEFRGSVDDLPPDLRKKIGNRIFGCDDCLDICPFNVNAKSTAEPGFQPFPWTLHPQLPVLANLTKDEFQSLTNGSPLRRPKHAGFIRNIQIGLDNHAPPIPLS